MLTKLVRAYQLRFPFGAGAATPPITLEERIAMDRPTLRDYLYTTERGAYEHKAHCPVYTYTAKNSVALFTVRPWERDLLKEDAMKAALLQMVRDQNGLGCEGLSKWRHVVLELPLVTFHITQEDAETHDTIRMRWIGKDLV